MSDDTQIFPVNLDIHKFQNSLHLSNCSKEVNQLDSGALNGKTILNLQNNSAGPNLDLLNNKDNFILKLKEVYISCGLTETPKELFNLKYLTVLNLSNNSLESLPKEIGNLCNLVILNLSSNKLSTLPKSLKHFQQLNYLDISSNKFYEVPDVLYYGMRGLNVLDLSCNQLTAFDVSPGCLTKLVELKISNNFLSKLPVWVFDNLCQLQLLHISENVLHFDTGLVNYWSTGVFESLQLLNIENCNLSNENIQILPFFKNLKILQIGNKKYLSAKEEKKNYMGNLKLDIFKNSGKMKYLYLQNSGIGTLTSDIDCLKNLEMLDLSNNMLSWLPETFCNLVTLKILNLTSNHLYFLPSNIGGLVNLKQIHLGNNKLHQIPESFYNLKTLEFIDLYNNQIENIDPNIFKEKHLKGIDLGLNCLHFNFCKCSVGFDEITTLYICLKDSFRKHFCELDNRCDMQRPKLDCTFDETNSDSCSGGRNCSISSFEDEILSDPEVTPKEIQQSYHEDENWERKVSIEEQEDEFFDPNELIKFDRRCDFWTINFQNNYCPAKYHMPSVKEVYQRNFKLALQNEAVEDGQFDSD